MVDITDRTGPNCNDDSRLKYACDAGVLSSPCPSDTPSVHDLDIEDSNDAPSADSESFESPRLADLEASFRAFSESLARMERAEMEMIKAREASWLEAEKRRLEKEDELTRMMLQTQLQVAWLVAGKGPSRKRKRVEEDNDDSKIAGRKGALLLSLLQCNLTF